MNKTKAHCGCSIDRILQDGNYVFITGAQTQSDISPGKSYVVYTIRLGDTETKRRYSEFESLRNALCRLYPIMIVPPIPEKHSMVDYAALQTKVKDDLPMVEKRKRMLQTFLNRVAAHPVLGRDHVFHRFLEHNVPWSDVTHSPPLSQLPKNPLQIKVSTETPIPDHTYSKLLSSNTIPLPSATYILKKPDARFEESEKYTFRIANYMSNNLDKNQRKVIRRLGELANDYAELGGVYNGFSLSESGAVANAIEKVGQAVDASYTETAQLVTSLEGEFAEHIQEHAQYAHIIKQVLKFRHAKHAQVEMIESSLQSKKDMLENLLQIEDESRRLEEAISRERTIGPNAVNVDELNDEQSFGGDSANPYQTHNSSPQRYGSGYPRRNPGQWASPIKVMNAVGHSIQGIIDVDPEATRRNQIGKTKDAIQLLDEAFSVAQKDLGGASAELQAELDRFQREKVKDLRDMLIAYAKLHIRYCQKNLKSWQEARAEVEKISA